MTLLNTIKCSKLLWNLLHEIYPIRFKYCIYLLSAGMCLSVHLPDMIMI